MAGAIVLVVAFLIFVPAFLVTMGVVAAVLGTVLKDDAEARNEGSELLELNR